MFDQGHTKVLQETFGWTERNFAQCAEGNSVASVISLIKGMSMSPKRRKLDAYTKQLVANQCTCTGGRTRSLTRSWEQSQESLLSDLEQDLADVSVEDLDHLGDLDLAALAAEPLDAEDLENLWKLLEEQTDGLPVIDPYAAEYLHDDVVHDVQDALDALDAHDAHEASSEQLRGDPGDPREEPSLHGIHKKGPAPPCPNCGKVPKGRPRKDNGPCKACREKK